jgi:hypothetical protein
MPIWERDYSLFQVRQGFQSLVESWPDVRTPATRPRLSSNSTTIDWCSPFHTGTPQMSFSSRYSVSFLSPKNSPKRAPEFGLFPEIHGLALDTFYNLERCVA